MYKYNLIISIFSEDKKLEQTILKIKPLEKFNHKIETYDKVIDSVIESSDILIWDLDINQLFKFRNCFKENTKIIICNDKYLSEFSIADSIFLKPFDYEFIKYCFEKLLDKISLEEKLYYVNTCLDTVVDSIPDMIWIKSNEGIHTLLNKEFCNVVGKQKEDVIGKDHYEIWNVSKDDPNSGADICKKTEEEVIAAGHTLRFTEYVKSGNDMRQLITYKSPLYDRNGQIIGTVGFGHDITVLENMSIENEILLNSIPYAVLLRDNNGKIQNVNHHFENYFSVSKKEIIGTLYEDWKQKTFISDRNINNDGYLEGTTYNINGEAKSFELRFDNICDIFGNITGQVCIYRDVTLERKLEAQIIETSNVDFMTGLYNRRYLNSFIAKQQNGITISLFSIDLDHFKAVNDNYGHKTGDEAIILTSRIIKECFQGDLIVRMGGDEFLVIKIGDYKIDELKTAAQKLLDTLIMKFSEIKAFGNLSASIGITQNILDKNNITELINHSDIALYDAKNLGRARYSIYQEDFKA